MVEKVKAFCNAHKKPLLIALAVLVLLGAAGTAGGVWYSRQPKFQDLTVELGTEAVSMRQFFTRFTLASQASFVSDVSGIDLNRLGKTELTLRQGGKEETVTLTVQDTVAPTGRFLTHVTRPAGYVPDPRDFLEDLVDLSQTKVFFETDPGPLKNYSDMTLTVSAEDAGGNRISQECTLSIDWLKPEFQLELGQPLTAADLLLTPDVGTELLNQAYLDRFQSFPIGDYPILSTSGDKIMRCNVHIADTCGPELELQEVARDRWESADLEDFVVSASDVSGDVTLRLLTQPDFETLGPQTITVEARDIYNNVTTKDTTLYVRSDSTPPDISGLYAIYAEKHSTPNYTDGVQSVDATDGVCEWSYDASAVDTSVSGIYYVTYTSRDKSGNVATEYRRVEVAHDEEDTAALVESIAAKLGNDPEDLRDYVRNTIWYNHDWGGDDPVWYGFTSRGGNCYVHAKCLKALFDLKGITSQLIWVTGPEGFDQSHYWLQVYINGGWKHIDPTPSDLHGRYSLMNDAQRYETLVSGGVQRDWDRSRWPACS